ncbi:MAG TPA: hypothetical protein VGO87_07500, partial [Acidimicrobiia bacterium]
MRLPSLILALGLSAACGVKPSAMHDTAAERARRAPQDFPSGFNGGLADSDVNADAVANPYGEKTTASTLAASVASNHPTGEAGGVTAAGPPATVGAGAVTVTSGPTARTATGTARTASAETPSTRSGPVYGPPSPSPAPGPPPGATEPPAAPTPPREGFDGGAPDRTGVTDTTIKIGIHA